MYDQNTGGYPPQGNYPPQNTGQQYPPQQPPQQQAPQQPYPPQQAPQQPYPPQQAPQAPYPPQQPYPQPMAAPPVQMAPQVVTFQMRGKEEYVVNITPQTTFYEAHGEAQSHYHLFKHKVYEILPSGTTVEVLIDSPPAPGTFAGKVYKLVMLSNTAGESYWG